MNDASRPRAAWGWSALLLLGLLLLPLGPRAEAGDDVPDGVQAAYDAALGLYAKGDRASFEKALGLLDTRKDEALSSIDYWTLYARVWNGLKKDEAGLWEGIVKERQDAAPKSVVFDLAHARVSKKPKTAKRWIESALKRDKENLAARTAMGAYLLREEDEDAGAEMLEEVLEDDPGNVDAAMALAELSLEEGFPAEALEFLEGALETSKDARLYHTAALCYERKAQDKDHQECMAKALDAAARALGLEPNDAHINTYNKLLKLTGDAATAAKALKEHFARTKHPLLGALLAETAFEAGDYEGALLGLKAADEGDLTIVKGLVEAHARLGQQADAMRLADKVLQMDSAGRLFVARIAVWLGDASAAQKHLGQLADDDAKLVRARAHAWAGEADAIAALAKKEIAEGSRSGEDYLTLWFQARILERLGGELAPAVRDKLLKARFAAGAKVQAQGGDYSADIGEVKTKGWPQRAVTYFRSACGTPFELAGDYISRSFDLDGDENMMTFYQSVNGKARCGADEQNFDLRFNGKKKKMTSDGGWIEVLGDQGGAKLGEFGPAEKAFAEACAAWLKGDHDAAEQAAAKALRVEPAFSRVKVYRSLARALSPNGEKRADAKDAKEAVTLWRDDFELRRTVIMLRAWAGDAELGTEIEALAAREAQLNVRRLADL